MHITFVNGLYPPHGAGGAEVTLQLLAAQFANRGHICSVISLTRDRHSQTEAVDGIPVHYLPLANLYWPHGSRRPRALRPLFQAADAFNPVMGVRVRRTLAAL